MAERTTADVLLVGESGDADVRIEQIRLDDLARATFRIHTPWGADEVRLAVSGRHMAIDAALAVAAAGLCDVPLYDAVMAIAGTEVSAGRMRVHHLASGAIVVDDAYNANPVSMRAGLDALAAIDARRRVAVLGVMAELAEPQAAHREIAQHAVGLGIELIPVGTDLYGIAPVDDPAAALGALQEGTAVLVKGSLVAGLQALVARLLTTG
jgi:UDP-N-acetylmuramoyl-tripeptide--D-alanyl-D-alanine ligase